MKGIGPIPDRPCPSRLLKSLDERTGPVLFPRVIWVFHLINAACSTTYKLGMPTSQASQSQASSEQEAWACAFEMLRKHGDKASLYIAQRVGTLVLQGDLSEVERWRAVASKVHRLTAGSKSAQ